MLADRLRIALHPDGHALVVWHEVEKLGEYGPISSVWAAVVP